MYVGKPLTNDRLRVWSVFWKFHVQTIYNFVVIYSLILLFSLRATYLLTLSFVLLLWKNSLRPFIYNLKRLSVRYFQGLLSMLKRSIICCYRICMAISLTFRKTAILSRFFTDHYCDRVQFYWGCFCGLFDSLTLLVVWNR